MTAGEAKGMETERYGGAPEGRAEGLRGASLGLLRALAVALALAGPAGVFEPVATARAQSEGEVFGGPEAVAAVAVAEPAVAPDAPEAPVVPVAAAPAKAQVTMIDNRNISQRLTVKAGTTVTWVNAGLLPHTVSTQSGRLESGMVQPGQSFSFTFDTPGEYAYFCLPHVFIGMTGTVVVE